MKEKQLLLFDFDGVIADTLELCMSICRKFIPDITEEEYKKLFHVNVYEHDHFPEGMLEQFDGFYQQDIRTLKAEKYVSDLLEELSRERLLAIVSSAHGENIAHFLKNNSLDLHFNDILGHEVSKSKVKKIEMSLDRYDSDPKKAVFITDSLGDIEEAHAAGIEAIGYTGGFHDEQTLKKGNPKEIIHDLRDLKDLFS